MKISQQTIDEVERIGREYPDGIRTCAELQKMEPGRRPCSCGRCPDTRERAQAQKREGMSELRRLAAECHRRKWRHEVSNPEAFAELHRIGNEILAALKNL